MKRVILASLLLSPAASAGEPGNETYNFYFQKAPGPVTAPKAPDAPVAATAPTGNVVAALPAPEPTAQRKHFQLSLGEATIHPGDRLWGQNEEYSDIETGGQWTVGFEYDPIPLVGFTAEGYFLRVDNAWEPGHENRFDYGLGVAVTPLRWQPVHWLGIACSGVGGVMSVPATESKSTLLYTDTEGRGAYTYNTDMTHETTPYLGGRVALAFGTSTALRFDVRKITKFDTTMSTLSLALLL